jgi:hypothetical protein
MIQNYSNDGARKSQEGLFIVKIMKDQDNKSEIGKLLLFEGEWST